jgi:dephospho-CoA kinase
MKKIALTGGIACGKSLLSFYLRKYGVETIDADDIVHELTPEEERKRLAAIVFKDPLERRKLEERIHPIVKEKIEEFFASPGESVKVAIIPLLFEVHWEGNFDIICSVVSSKDKQIERMTTTRGYTRDEALLRMASQMSVEEKARNSHYVIINNSTPEELETETRKFVTWLKTSMCSRNP